MAQLAERAFPAQEDPGLNPAISNFYKQHLLTVN